MRFSCRIFTSNNKKHEKIKWIRNDYVGLYGDSWNRNVMVCNVSNSFGGIIAIFPYLPICITDKRIRLWDNAGFPNKVARPRHAKCYSLILS